MRAATIDGGRLVLADLGAAVVTDPGQAFDHGPFDVILELAGAPNLPANLDGLGTGGHLRIPVAATFPLEQAQEADDRFAAGGKLVLTT
jgi:protein-L-isoaspartate O-methyltransferase